MQYNFHVIQFQVFIFFIFFLVTNYKSKYSSTADFFSGGGGENQFRFQNSFKKPSNLISHSDCRLYRQPRRAQTYFSFSIVRFGDTIAFIIGGYLPPFWSPSFNEWIGVDHRDIYY